MRQLNKFITNLSCFVFALVLCCGCRKKAFDDYYNRPASLAAPIYPLLESKGNFKNLLACIDRAGYKSTLSSAGYWTFFAPNDAAFQQYFISNNTSLDKIDSATARRIVTYCLVYNAFQTDHLADFQSSLGWVPISAFKRRTSNYDGFYTDQGPAGPNTVLLSTNRNNGAYLFGDNNNKYIPYFYTTYMAANSLSATDYNYFFPNTTYSGFNVLNASVVTKDILAENGVIDEIDRVILPPPSLEQQLASNSQYSVFKGLYDQFMVSYQANTDATHRYLTLTGKTNTVYIKQYSNLLVYAPNNENYLKIDDNDAQQNGYTLFAPTNTAVTNYLNTVLLEFYKTLPALPPNIVADFLNAHMFTTTVWPSKFNSTINTTGELPKFNPGTDVVDKQFCSNGVFYGTNKVQVANVFNTVYARAYLDPAYSIMTRLYDLTLKAAVTSPGLKYTVFMLPDATLRALGYDYSTATSAFTSTINGVTTTGAVPLASLQRILNLNVVPTPNGELDNLAGDGIAETNAGEYIRWHNNTVSSAGTVEKNLTLNVVGSRNYSNGKVYYLGSGALDVPVNTVAGGIAANAGTTAAPGPYYDFYQYLLTSSVYNVSASEIIGLQIGANYTVFIPSQAAMKQAVVDGFLPGTTTIVGGVPTFASFTYNPTSTVDKDKIAHFIYFHILNGITIAADGKKGVTGVAFPSLLKDSNGNVLNVITFNQPNNLRLQDNQVRFANVIAPNNNSYFPATSNYLGNHVLFHQIDNYLRFNY